MSHEPKPDVGDYTIHGCYGKDTQDMSVMLVTPLKVHDQWSTEKGKSCAEFVLFARTTGIGKCV